jgi:DNA-binding PucR family transcriptional regulator
MKVPEESGWLVSFSKIDLQHSDGYSTLPVRFSALQAVVWSDSSDSPLQKRYNSTHFSLDTL